ncbi:MAG: biotin--[acetyl-CoA-carboxylase] ligase [Actinobacteria bacterium HGW-Actinobacteria-4]|nr:MAG: biotin--[acetyl-CoA-carboxylase] ligase [Actinobacteria bacterium HGW-Actinobacteria-4]
MSSHGADAVAASRAPLTGDAVEPLVKSGVLTRAAVVNAAASTNSELLEALAADPVPWPHLSAFVADHQTAGRGRAGRVWETPAGAALTVSLVIRPQGIGRSAWGWAPLVVGLATVRALRSWGVEAWVKWPNDIIVQTDTDSVPGWGRWRKCVGILCESAPGQDAVIAGIGINVSQGADELPVPHATSLALVQAGTLDRVSLLRSVALELGSAVAAWEGDDTSIPISHDVAAVCASIGWDVTVDVPSGPPVAGTAIGLSDEGGLVIQTPSGQRRTVLAGDVRVRQS